MVGICLQNDVMSFWMYIMTSSLLKWCSKWKWRRQLLCLTQLLFCCLVSYFPHCLDFCLLSNSYFSCSKDSLNLSLKFEIMKAKLLVKIIVQWCHFWRLSPSCVLEKNPRQTRYLLAYQIKVFLFRARQT